MRSYLAMTVSWVRVSTLNFFFLSPPLSSYWYFLCQILKTGAKFGPFFAIFRNSVYTSSHVVCLFVNFFWMLTHFHIFFFLFIYFFVLFSNVLKCHI